MNPRLYHDRPSLFSRTVYNPVRQGANNEISTDIRVRGTLSVLLRNMMRFLPINSSQRLTEHFQPLFPSIPNRQRMKGCVLSSMDEITDVVNFLLSLLTGIFINIKVFMRIRTIFLTSTTFPVFLLACLGRRSARKLTVTYFSQ